MNTTEVKKPGCLSYKDGCYIDRAEERKEEEEKRRRRGEGEANSICLQ